MLASRPGSGPTSTMPLVQFSMNPPNLTFWPYLILAREKVRPCFLAAFITSSHISSAICLLGACTRTSSTNFSTGIP